MRLKWVRLPIPTSHLQSKSERNSSLQPLIIGKVLSLKAFFTHFFKPSIQRTVRRALALRPRGAIPNDVLVLNSLRLSGHRLQLEWRARDIHPWDRDLPPTRQAELFSKQALQDTDAALIRLFQRLPEIEQIEFQVLNPLAFGGVILTGVVDREQALDPEPPPSLRMRLNMLGVRYKIADDHLVLLPANSWAPMLKKRARMSSSIRAS